MKKSNLNSLALEAKQRLKDKGINITEKNAKTLATLLASEMMSELIIHKELTLANFIKLRLHSYKERNFFSNGEWKKTRAYMALKVTINHKLKGYLKSKVKQ